MVDVGSGSGYLTACIARLQGDKGKVIGLETIEGLVKAGRENIRNDCPEYLDSGKIVIKS